MRILAICGSPRLASSNMAMLRTAAGAVSADVEFAFADGIFELPHFNPDLDEEGAAPPDVVAAWRATVEAADGVVISSPEYAHGVPGSLKNALDWLVSTPALFEKPVLLLNAAPAGGMFAQNALAEILRTMNADVLDASRLEPFTRTRGGGRDAEGAILQELRDSVRALEIAVHARARRRATHLPHLHVHGRY